MPAGAAWSGNAHRARAIWIVTGAARQLDALPQAFRSVFVLRVVEELSVEETTQVLGTPEATVRTRHFRARSLRREALAQEIDLAERDLYEFGGAHCDRTVAAVLARLTGTVPSGR